MRKHLCGVPSNQCVGGNYPVNKGFHINKVHNSPEEAFKCHARYLMSQGYTQIGSREFRPSDGGPIQVLTKKSRFGAAVRRGKGGEKGEKTKRATFDRGGGTIISM